MKNYLLASVCFLLLQTQVLAGADKIYLIAGSPLMMQHQSDSLQAQANLDSAMVAFNMGQYNAAIYFAVKSYKHSQQIKDTKFSVDDLLLIAQSYKKLYNQQHRPAYFNNILKYYLKAIGTLELSGSEDDQSRLADVYLEYGSIFEELDLKELTVKNLENALKYTDKTHSPGKYIRIVKKLAFLQYELKNLDSAISNYNNLYRVFNLLGYNDQKINVQNTLIQLYRETYNYDLALKTAKDVLMHYTEKVNQEKQISYLSLVGEISYAAGNRDQADKTFKRYFSLVNRNHSFLTNEINSKQYIRNLITEGDIYTWSTDNGYWSDYSTAIRYYNTAQKFTDFKLYPDLASIILNRTGSIYFKESDYKTSITYFELALHYAMIDHKLDKISENHIMLARAFDKLGKWKDASKHYEMHAAYKDTIILAAEKNRKDLNAQSVDNKKEVLRAEQILERIKAQERQERAMVEKELRNTALENELELYRQDVTLKDLQIKNQKLAENNAVRNYMLTKEQLENELKAKKIDQLNAEKERQALLLKNKEADQRNKRQRIKILEQENSLAKSRQGYYILSIVLISLILLFIILVNIQRRKANRKLTIQKDKIARQARELKEAYQNLELLSVMGRAITSSLIIDEIIDIVYKNLNKFMDASVFGIGVYDKNSHEIFYPGIREKGNKLDDRVTALTDQTALATFCFNHQKDILINNFYKEYSQYITQPTIPQPGDGNATSIVYLPLTIGQKKIGVLTVQSFEENAFTDYHINIIRNIAIYAKIALENASVYKQLEEKSENLKKANASISRQNALIEQQNHALVNLNEEKNNLIGILAHDLRNPLATAMSMTELVRFKKENLSAEQQQASLIIWRGLNRMNDMISKILDVKAIESQNLNLEMVPMQVIELWDHLEKMFAEQANDKYIKLHFPEGSVDALIMADRTYFGQILENLISNALKFSPLHSNVFVEVKDVVDEVHICVRDEGPGIPERDHNDLFKKYKKLTPRPTGGEQSTGLGLSIVKKYAEAMQARVYYNKKYNRGAEFVICFKKAEVAVH